MTVNERAEANANLILWCTHVLGAYDVYATVSHGAAVTYANQINRAIWQRRTAPDDVLCFAYAKPWPHSPESHAVDIAGNPDFQITAEAIAL